MQAIAGAIVILAGSILVSAGVLAQSYRSSDNGYVAGGLLIAVGLFVLFKKPLQRGWDAIPVDEKKPDDDRTT